MLGSGPDIYLVDQVFTPFEAAASSWLKKSPVKVAKADIRRITCIGPDGTVRYIFERPEKGKAFELTTPHAERAVKESSLNGLPEHSADWRFRTWRIPAPPPNPCRKAFPPVWITPFITA